MKKKLLLASAFISLVGATAQAQTPVALDRKWDGAVEHLFQEQQNFKAGVKAVTAAEKTDLVISCTDAEAVVDAILLAGYEAENINGKIVSAKVPVSFIPELAGMDEVSYINGARQFYPTMTSTRKVTGVEKIHAAEGLETPFSGKGVIVGVIDQGFEYKHLAFLDEKGESRVRAVWNHQAGQRPTEKIPSTGDNMQGSHGHATHVTNIAAGSKVEGNDYYGIAHNAEIIMIPSNFKENDVLQEAKYIRDFANKEGKPYVINMSFGSQVGPHDGSSVYCTGMNEFSQPGGIMVAAMGNEGELKLHAHHEFKKENEKIYLIVKPSEGSGVCNLDLWEQTADGQKHLKVKPLVFNKSTKKKDFKTESFWKQCSTSSGNVDPNNKKEHFYYQVYLSSLQEGNQSNYFGVEIEGNPGDEFHAWVNPGWGEVYKPLGNGYATGDNEYCVGEGGASIPYAVAVASYNGNNGNFTSAIDGDTYNFGGRMGDISSFSSRGPSLGSEPKPLVAAPGNAVCSAVSRFGDFDKNAIEIVSIIKKGINKYYYEVMSGTSMASPTVAGIVALWLEANPELTYEQVKGIIKETSKLDSHTGQKDDWDIKRGYGKIDAYEGLKKALQLAENLGINDQLNTETPVSIKNELGQFRVLFNNDESYATLSLYNTSGAEVKSEQLSDIRRGHEVVLATEGLSAGVYILRIQTTASSVSKKVLVK